MAGSFDFGLTREEEIGILVLLVYLNTGIAWYYFICRKSKGYKYFEICLIGEPPRRPVVAPSPTTITTTTTARGEPSSPRFRFHPPSINYALKRWGFVTASVLLFWFIHALVRLAILLGTLLTKLGAKIAACAYAVYEMTWERELWKARREWVKELAVDGPSSAEGEKPTMPTV